MGTRRRGRCSSDFGIRRSGNARQGEQGAVGTPHTHYHTQTTYVASGKFEFTVNGEKQIVSAGDGVYIEPDAEHGCTCLEAGILIDCFSPMRADFLKP